MLIKIAICEDEPVQSRNIRRIVNHWGETQEQKVLLYLYENCESFLMDWSEQMDFDLCILDIDLGEGINGMELARRIREKDERIAILFITGLPEYMSQGYDVRAFHFLVKPVNEERLGSVLDKALKEIRKKEKNEYLMLEAESGSELVPLSHILYAEAFSHTVELYLVPEKDGDIVCREVGMCLGDMAKLLPRTGFFRCHRSYLVHLAYIRRLEKAQIFLDYGAVIPVSRGKREELYQAFLAYHRDIPR